MKKLNLNLLLMLSMFVIVSCYQKPTLESGKEVELQNYTYILNEEELNHFKDSDLEDIVSEIKIDLFARVYLIQVGEKYSKIRTLTDIEGYIPTEFINPVVESGPAYNYYFSDKRIGIINTIVDGTDVVKVNLWKDKEIRNDKVAALFNGSRVAILSEEGEYIQIGTINGKIGWCMKGFVIIEE